MSGNPGLPRLPVAYKMLVQAFVFPPYHPWTFSVDSFSGLIDFLSEHYGLSDEQVEQAREVAEEEARAVEQVLVDQEAVPPQALALAYAHIADLAPIDLGGLQFDPTLLEDMPVALMRRHHILPISKIGKTLTVAVSDPFNILALEGVSTQSGYRLMAVVAPEKQLEEMIESRLIEQGGGDLEDALSELGDDSIQVTGMRGDDFDIDHMMEMADDKPIIRIVNSIMMEALRKRASDIHIEPELETCRVRYRVDGVLVEAGSPPKSMLNAISSRIKIMSNLDIAERRLPQDGRCRIRAMDKDIDIRVSILPIIHGEKIVMRILDKSNLPGGLGDLSLDDYSFKAFSHALAQPYGMIFVTGPTGSGKTTTLYSALQELNKPDTNIITVEDPVEYQLRGINQVQTQAEVGLTFAAGLRSILRQDPDIVLVGEVRDLETATIAVQAALTGHLVLSTLHTNDAVGAVSRLNNMGIEPFMLASALILSQAQRLFRRLCPGCKTPISMGLDELAANHMDLRGYCLDGAQYHKADKCPKCNQLGYRGRGAIMEILEINDLVRGLILRNAPTSELREAAIQNGMITLQRAGLNKAHIGQTSLEEVLRITSSI